MAKNIKIANTIYKDVPSVQLTTETNGTALYVDTSDANAIANMLASGYTAYVNGVKITGNLETNFLKQEDNSFLLCEDGTFIE